MKKIVYFLTACTLFSAIGCGLDDYEKRMDIERRRVKMLDEQEAFLTGPIEPPEPRKVKTKDGETTVPAWPFDVYVRAPFAFERTSRSKDFYFFNDVYIYRYVQLLEKPLPEKPGVTVNAGNNLFVACSKVGEMNKAKETFNPGELSQAEFRRRVLRVMTDYYRKEYKSDFEFTPKNPNKEVYQPEFIAERMKPLPPVECETLEYTAAKEATTFFFCFHRNGVNQIALVYQVPESIAKDPKIIRARDLSIKSLDISENAIEKRKDFAIKHQNVVKK